MAIIDGGSSTAGKANVDSNYNLNVNLPTTVAQAGFVQHAYSPSSAISRSTKINEDGQLFCAEARQVFHGDFNAVTAVQSTRWGTNATTMTKAVQTNGFMRLNASAITTTTTGIALYSNRIITLENGYDYRVRFQLRHVNATATNKQCDVGLGYYLFAAGQANAMNEFVGFRFTTTGGLLGVLETSEGGAAGAQTVNINSNVPYADNVSKEYEILITELEIQFWIDGVYQAKIAKPSTMYGVIKGASLPFIFRVFNSGAASAAATFDIAQISIIKNGADDGQSHPARMAAMDKISYYPQPDLITTASPTHNMPASTTIPTAATGSNTASVLNSLTQMGGFYRMNGASFNVATHSNVLVAAYQNPLIPTAAGVATNARNFYVTSITLSPQVITTILAGGPYTALWCAWIGNTAISLATADADGTTAVAQKAPRLVPLSRLVSFAATAAVGTIETGQGDFTVNFPTPLVVHPGEYLSIGQRLLTITAVTSGTIDGSINVNGYWD